MEMHHGALAPAGRPDRLGRLARALRSTGAGHADHRPGAGGRPAPDDRRQPGAHRSAAHLAGHGDQALRGHRLQRRDRGAAREEAGRRPARPVLVCAGRLHRRGGPDRHPRDPEAGPELPLADHRAQGPQHPLARRPQGQDLRLRRSQLHLRSPVPQDRDDPRRAQPRRRPARDLRRQPRRQRHRRAERQGRRRGGGRRPARCGGRPRRGEGRGDPDRVDLRSDSRARRW